MEAGETEAVTAAAERAADAEVLNVAIGQEMTLVDGLSAGLPLVRRARARALLRNLIAQEREHIDGFTKAMRGLGAENEAEAEDLDISDLRTERDALLFAYELSSSQLTHFLDDVTHLQSRAPQSFAASIAASQAQHLVALRRLLGADLASPCPRRSTRAKCRRPAGWGMIGPMTAPLYAIGRFCSRHHYPTIAAWLVAAVVLVVLGQASGDKTNDNLTLPGHRLDGGDGTARRQPARPGLRQQPAGDRIEVGSADRTQYAKAIEETSKRLQAMPEVNSAVSPLSAAGAEFLSQDRTVGYFPVVLGVGPGELTEEQAEAVLDAAGPAKRAGLETSVGAYVGQQLSKPDTGVSDAIGIAAAIVILLFAFGTATAMVLPIGSAIVGLAISLSLIRLLQNVVEVPSVAATLATMIGLGVGIDYALFIVTRHKLQLAEGMELRESIARATATAGGAVVFAGFTVVIALCSLAFAGIPLVSTLGFTAAIAVVVAVSRRPPCCRRCWGPSGPTSIRCGCPDTRPTPTTTSRTAGGKWARAWPPTVAVGARRARGAGRAGAADLPARARSERPQRPAQVDDRAPELRLTDQRVRAGGQRASAGRDEVPGPGRGAALAAIPGQVGRRRPRRRRRLRTDRSTRPGTVGVFTVISKSAPWADETVSLVEDLRDETIPERGREGPTAPPTSAARPPATSTWRRRSPKSCR